MNRQASPDHPINALLAERHSPYAFNPERDVDAADIASLFEAVRWTMSSYNAQPWRYIIGVKGQGENWGLIYQCLVEGNQPWAANAPLLVLGLVKTTFDHNGKDNAAAVHDLGAASAMLTVEATARGLAVHQMIGIEADKAVERFSMPEDVIPVTALAIGYAGEPHHVADAYAQRDATPRQRMPQDAFILS